MTSEGSRGASSGASVRLGRRRRNGAASHRLATTPPVRLGERTTRRRRPGPFTGTVYRDRLPAPFTGTVYRHRDRGRLVWREGRAGGSARQAVGQGADAIREGARGDECIVVHVAPGGRGLERGLDLLRLAGRKMEAKFEPARVGDIKHSLADTSAARKLLKYRPQVDFESGLARTFEWYSSAGF